VKLVTPYDPIGSSVCCRGNFGLLFVVSALFALNFNEMFISLSPLPISHCSPMNPVVSQSSSALSWILYCHYQTVLYLKRREAFEKKNCITRLQWIKFKEYIGRHFFGNAVFNRLMLVMKMYKVYKRAVTNKAMWRNYRMCKMEVTVQCFIVKCFKELLSRTGEIRSVYKIVVWKHEGKKSFAGG
jgi:hypothetical protein